MSQIISPQKPGVAGSSAVKRRSRAWLWILVVAVLAAGAYLLLKRSSPAAGPGGRRGGLARGGFQPPPTVVNLQPARLGTLPDYITALGTVTALNTVTVRSRVDGALVKVNFEEGQQVRAGDVLAEIDPRPFQVELEQAQGQLARDRALVNNAQLDLQRYQEAHEAVTPQQVDTAKASVAQYEGAVKSDEAAVESANLQLSFCRVVAPINGRTGLRQVDVGNLIRSSDTNGIVVLTEVQPIAIRFSVPEDRLPIVARAMRSEQKPPVEIYDRSMLNKIATGELTAIDNQIDVTTGTVRMKAVAENQDQSLFPNQFVNVKLLVSIEKDVVLVPTTAVQISGSDRFVYVYKEDTTVERRTVKVGNSQGMVTAILEGVAAGEIVVTDSLDRLQTGAKVLTRNSTPAGPVTAPNGADSTAPKKRGTKKSSGKWSKKGS